MVSAEQRRQFDTDGYIIFEKLFQSDEIDIIRNIIDQIAQESEKAFQLTGTIHNSSIFNAYHTLNLLDPTIQAFIADERFVQITTSLIGPNIRLYNDQALYKTPEASKTFPWHQDNGYRPVEPKNFVTCWLALDDVNIENGCVWVQPRTHLQGVVEHVKTDTGFACYQGDEQGIPVELKKGSMVAFSSLLFHRSTPNVSQVTRKGYIIQYTMEGSINPITGQEYKFGPIIARDGKKFYSEFQNETTLF